MLSINRHSYLQRERDRSKVSKKERETRQKQAIYMEKEDLALQGQANVWKANLAYIDSMVLQCAVELGIADIIHSQAQPLPLHRIAELLSPPAADNSALFRIMRFLVRKGFFTKRTDPTTGDTLYGATPSSQWLVHGSKPTLLPVLLLSKTFPHGQSSWHHLSDCVRLGGTAFRSFIGVDYWSFMTQNSNFGEVFNSAMACTVEITLHAMATHYKDGFLGLDSVVDVGGGTGAALGELTRMYPGIRGINFDRPHVVAAAPEYPGVSHVGGDMFESIPEADAVFMKWTLHCFQDEQCIKILKNCRKAIPEKKGKLIIAEAVLDAEEDDPFGDVRMAYDIMMLANTGGKERTEEEWNQLLKLGGFPRVRIIRIPAITSIIEAYPE